MKWKAAVRRNWTFFALWLALAGFFIPLFGLMFYSSYPFLNASFYTLLAALISFAYLALLPALIYESLRMRIAKLWKRGEWLSVRKRREMRSGKRFAS